MLIYLLLPIFNVLFPCT